MTTHNDIVAALRVLRPGAAWSLTGDDLTGLAWHDGTQSRPTDVEILDAVPGAALAVAQAEAIARIDAAAEAARCAYITPGSGQALVYQRKGQQARDCLANHDAQNPPAPGAYTALEAEVGITGGDVLEVAAVVAGLETAWAAVADQIEAIRLTAKRDVAAAATPAEVDAIEAAVVWPVPA